MEGSQLCGVLISFSIAILTLFMACRMVYTLRISPARAHRKLKENGFVGPTPVFPWGNLKEMKRKSRHYDSDVVNHGPEPDQHIHHDIHSIVFPHFAHWQKLYGKVFIYWLGTEPFLYVAKPNFLKEMAAIVTGKNWGKPDVFKMDREPMFGKGLLMTEGEEWVNRRHIIAPAFSPSYLKDMTTLMVDSTMKMIANWSALMDSCGGEAEIDAEKELTAVAGEIIARSSFGISPQDCKEVLKKLRALQFSLFNSNRMVGVPYNKFVNPKQTLEARRLGKEIDALLISTITDRKRSKAAVDDKQRDLLGILLEDGLRGKKLTTRELVDECKTFFFGGHETTALAFTWTLLLLAMHPEWQGQLREEIKQVVGDNEELDATMLSGLKKMGWVMNEVLRIYSPAPNVQRQVRKDTAVHGLAIPKGTNIWIDVVSMNHDPTLWGDDVNDFKPARFRDDVHGGCKQKIGYIPFGFGGRMCIGKNLMMIEYKVVLSLILARFSFELSPKYCHSPVIMLSLRPTHGLPLVVRPL